MFARRTVSSLARLTLAVLLFSQGALAFAGCGLTPHAAAEAIATGMMRAEPAPPCHERDADERPNTNLCLEQCLSADRSLDTPEVKVHARSTALMLVVPPAPLARPLVVTRAMQAPVPAAAPPPRILFQSLRI
jgi:hypothetical protein